MFTGGCFAVGAVIDLFTLGGQIDQFNTSEELKTIRASATAAHVDGPS
jgi:hypothetical protein